MNDADWNRACLLAAQMVVDSDGEIPVRSALIEAVRNIRPHLKTDQGRPH